MHTLFDFITHVKGVEYVLALLFIAGYILYWEVLKPKPFQSLSAATRSDVEHLRRAGYHNAMKSVGRVAAAPFIGLAYLALLPVSFVFALAIALLNAVGRLVGAGPSLGWRPVEAYFAGRKKKKSEGAPQGGQGGK